MPAAKKPAAKKTSKKKAVSKQSPVHSHLKLSKPSQNFWNVKPDVQTLYWAIIGVALIGTAIINFNLNLQVNELINELDTESSTVDVPVKAQSAEN